MQIEREQPVQKKAEAFAPAGISSFFEICDTTNDGKRILNPEMIGARGGGFVTEKGVITKVTVSHPGKNNIIVAINGKDVPEAKTTRTVVDSLLKKSNEKYDVKVMHTVQVPIGSGFGSSASGALSTSLALSKALNLNYTLNDLGRIAHAAEIRCRTGLGTVGPIMIGGCILTLEPGAPGKSIIDRIPISSDTTIVAGVISGIATKSVLASREKRLAVNRNGRKTLERVLSDPSLENFLTCCMDFAEETGFMNDKLRRLAKLAEQAGAIGAAQNMVGETIHAVTTSKNAENVVQAFKQVLSQDQITVSKVDFQGARLLG
jgi:pantoate kinase